VLRKSAKLAKSGVSPTSELSALLTSLKKTKGWDGLVGLIYNTAATLNGFDQYGHFGRTLVTLSNCLDYEPTAVGQSECVARFNGPNAGIGASGSSAQLSAVLQRLLTEESGGIGPNTGPATAISGATAAEPEAAAKLSGQQALEPLLHYAWGVK
jgi:hypothetical protein